MSSVFICPECYQSYNKDLVKSIYLEDKTNYLCPILNCEAELIEVDGLVEEIYPFFLKNNIDVFDINLGNFSSNQEIFSYALFDLSKYKNPTQFLELCNLLSNKFERVRCSEQLNNNRITLISVNLDESIEEKLKALSEFILYLYEIVMTLEKNNDELEKEDNNEQDRIN